MSTPAVALLLSACAAGPAEAPPAALPARPPPAAPADPPPPWDPATSPEAVATALAQAPALPGAPLVAVCFLSGGDCHIIDQDGTYRLRGPDGALVIERPRGKGRPPPSAEAPRLSAPALARLRALIDAADAIPAAVPLVQLPPGARLPSGAIPRPQVSVWTLGAGAGPRQLVAHVVPTVAETYGPLAPLYTALDEEALGGWMNE